MTSTRFTKTNTDARASDFWRSLWKATPAYLFVTGVRAAFAERA